VDVEDRLLDEGGLMDEESKAPRKRVYEPPRISVVNLRPEEAVLGACKNMSSAGPIGGSCTAAGPCMVPGS
jgi:hypothetical protein